jgi:transposase-like protein
MLKLLREGDDLVVVSLVQALIPVALEKVNELIREEVEKLAGERYKHGKLNYRWGSQWGSIYLRDQKVPLRVPRVRDKLKNEEIALSSYQKLQKPYEAGKEIFLRLLLGLSTHKYEECIKLVPQAFGLSASNLSTRFKEFTEQALRELQTRRLDNYDFICIYLDGKRYEKEGILVAVGITIEGNKLILGIEQMGTENAKAIRQFFDKLKERGLRYGEGILFVVDGSKGLIKAIKRAFREYAFIQRCHWHKVENVISYLNKSQQDSYRKKIKQALSQTTYESAKQALKQIEQELKLINPSAADSLREGQEEVLTLHRLGLYPELRLSLSTTNVIESILSQLGQYTDKVDYWRGGRHIQRWVAAGLIYIEPRLRKIKGYRYLKLLRYRLKEEIKRRQDLVEKELTVDEVLSNV